MARKVLKQIIKVAIDDFEGLEGCVIHVNTGIRMGTLMELDQRNAKTLLPFMKEVLVEWEGFDVPCNEEGFKDLTPAETNAILQAVMRVIGNPQMTSSASG